MRNHGSSPSMGKDVLTRKEGLGDKKAGQEYGGIQPIYMFRSGLIHSLGREVNNLLTVVTAQLKCPRNCSVKMSAC